MIILGLNINHADTSACIIVDGLVIAAIEEERFVRIKHYAGFPENSIDFCLQSAQINMSEVDFVTLNYLPTANLKQKILYSAKNIASVSTFKKILNFKKKLLPSNDLDSYLRTNNFSASCFSF